MTTKKSITLIVFSCIIATTTIMVASDYFLRDKIFGINLLLWPLAFILPDIVGLKLINKKTDYIPSIFKSFSFGFIVALISSGLFAIYWNRERAFQLEDFYGGIMMILPQNVFFALIMALLLKKK